MSARIALLLPLLLASIAAPLAARDFRCTACDRKEGEVERCQRMDPGAYRTALLFNPPGMKTLYERSSCLQQLAEKYVDATLCAEVRERRSLFFDGSAISRGACLTRVEAKADAAPAVVIHDLYRPQGVAWFRNGNGRDTDVHVTFAGSYRHGYLLSLSMLDETGARSEVLHSSEYSLGPSTREIRILVRQEAIGTAAAGLGLPPPYRFRVAAAIDDPSLAELEQFAAMTPAQRRNSVDQVLDPARLERDPRNLAAGGVAAAAR